MTWLHFAIITAIFYGLFDLFVKLTAGKIEDGLAALVMNFISTLVLIAFVLFMKTRGIEPSFTKEGLRYAAIAGVLIGLASITFIRMFSTGSNLATGVAVVRVGMVMLAILFGALLLKEPITTKQVLGFVLALAGLGLILA